METRIKIVIQNYKRELQRIKRKINELKWSIKYAPSMTINGEERLKEYQKELQDIRYILSQLEWITEGSVEQ